MSIPQKTDFQRAFGVKLYKLFYIINHLQYKKEKDERKQSICMQYEYESFNIDNNRLSSSQSNVKSQNGEGFGS